MLEDVVTLLEFLSKFLGRPVSIIQNIGIPGMSLLEYFEHVIRIIAGLDVSP